MSDAQHGTRLQPIAYIHTPFPQQLVVEATAACNQNCIFCGRTYMTRAKKTLFALADGICRLSGRDLVRIYRRIDAKRIIAYGEPDCSLARSGKVSKIIR